MKFPYRFSFIALALATALLVAACGGGSGGNANAGGDVVTETADGGAKVTLTPVGNEMKYEQTEFTVRPGQEVHLIFRNTADSPAMQHNVVVLTTNDDAVVKRIGQAGTRAGKASDFVPEDDVILAHTPMSKPGETVEVTFTAPEEPGDYRYICTFPGHWTTMQGTMHVSEQPA